MGFRDAAFTNVVGGKQEYAPYKIFSPQPWFLVVSVKFHGDHVTVTLLRCF